jgi:GNAT superfamily N-acetyltransferase
VCAGLGSPGVAAGLVATLIEELGPLPAAHLPYAPLAELAAHLPPVYRYEAWDFRWTSTPPGPQLAASEVVRLTEADHDEITALLDAHHPGTSSRPGRRRIRCWYGIRDGGRLVACGADSSRGVGVLTGLTVAADRRGQGLGAALTTAMSRTLHEEFGVVSLGVEPDNVRAARLYERLGFTRRLPLVSVFFKA